MIKTGRLFFLVAVLVSGCSKANEGSTAQRSDGRTASAYFDEKCWIKPRSENRHSGRKRFGGVLAIYSVRPETSENAKSPGYVGIIYSSICSTESVVNNDGYDDAQLVYAIGEIPKVVVKELGIHENQKRFIENGDYLNLGSAFNEWPVLLMALEGEGAFYFNKNKKFISISNIITKKTQVMPREQMGAFIHYPKNRLDLYNQYMEGSMKFNELGYRVSR